MMRLLPDMRGAGHNDHEVGIAHIYSNLLCRRTGDEWTLVRTEDKFPELLGQTRWDFVLASPADYNHWLALEVKCLTVPKNEQIVRGWDQIIADLNDRLQGKIPGRYYVGTSTEYKFAQNQRRRLLDCLVEVVREVAPSLNLGDHPVEIGPRLADLFPEWPEDHSKQPLGWDMEKLRPVYPPRIFLLGKSHEEGSGLYLGMSPMVGAWVKPALQSAVRSVLASNRSPNRQLRLAKSKGAAKTILLLDEHIDFDIERVATAISGLDISLVSDIDEVYLVSEFDGERFGQVWPKVHD